MNIKDLMLKNVNLGKENNQEFSEIFGIGIIKFMKDITGFNVIN